MKWISFMLLCIALLMGACRHDDEPPREFALEIVNQYMPATVVFDRSDTEFYDKMKELSRKKFVVNSADELPDDHLGFNDVYRKINFKDYTLFVQYLLHPWKIEMFRNYYYIDNSDRNYYWQVNLGLSERDEEDTQLEITRFAILVRKLPVDSKVNMNIVLSSSGFDWGD